MDINNKASTRRFASVIVALIIIVIIIVIVAVYSGTPPSTTNPSPSPTQTANTPTSTPTSTTAPTSTPEPTLTPTPTATPTSTPTSTPIPMTSPTSTSTPFISETVHVQDTAGQPIQDATVEAWFTTNSTGTHIADSPLTDASGNSVITANSGDANGWASWKVTKSGYIMQSGSGEIPATVVLHAIVTPTVRNW